MTNAVLACYSLFNFSFPPPHVLFCRLPGPFLLPPFSLPPSLSFGLSHDHVRKTGSLVVAWTASQLSQLPAVLKANADAGDTSAVLLSRAELLELEPALSAQALGGVYCPREAVVEPFLVPICYASSAIANGADIRTGIEVVSAGFDGPSKVWEVETRETGEAAVGRSEPGELLVKKPPAAEAEAAERRGGLVRARTVINCAGLYGDHVEMLGGGGEVEKKKFTVTPRKGQFVVFRPVPGAVCPEIIVEPVATEITKGVIAWKTVYGNVVVGPTATDQESKVDRSTDRETVETLRKAGERMLPGLEGAEVLGTYSGLRPATEHRDYQIYANKERQWITVGGIRSTGLTASSGIGEHVGELWEDLAGVSPLKAFEGGSAKDGLLGVTAAANSPVPVNRNVTRCERVPSLKELSDDYKKRGDGTILIHGRSVRVTHPISSFGMGSFGIEKK